VLGVFAAFETNLRRIASEGNAKAKAAGICNERRFRVLESGA
jgi:hypothetical protein